MLAVLIAAAAACSSNGGAERAHRNDTNSSEPDSSTTVARRVYHWPLTGLPTTDTRATTRPALTVKVENIAASRPQIGIDLADVVYEEVVECNITRLAAVFQSHIPAEVGPIRSVRKTDQELVRPLHGIFAYSGGAPYAIASINTAPVVRLDETTAGAAMFRMAGRGGAPHNLFARGLALYQHAPTAAGPPHALFDYASAAPAGGAPAHSVTIGFQSNNVVTWTWDPARRVWLRDFAGTPDAVLGGAQLAFRNVVVLGVDYSVGQGECNSVGAEAELVGAHGALTLFRDGEVFHGTWRYDPSDATVHLFDANGDTLPLTPGDAWVELPKPEFPVTVG